MPGNVPQAMNVTYYAQRASAGLIISEAAQVSPEGVGYPATPGIHSPEQVQGWRAVTDAVHANGGRMFVQLWYCGRISHPDLLPALARLIKQASQHSQLWVVSHASQLVAALNEHPDCHGVELTKELGETQIVGQG